MQTMFHNVSIPDSKEPGPHSESTFFHLKEP